MQGMTRGKVWELPKAICGPRKISRDVRIEVWEIDSPDPDDHLGTHMIRVDGGFGEKKATFNSDGAHYVLKYRLDP
jgi:hypothetical protein